ncbi:MAG TPA: hypothetical protein VMT68_13955 [Caulobacteraceae bacterium]|nr:hypothetical protein [Caulobacteraceae bacterium]
MREPSFCQQAAAVARPGPHPKAIVMTDLIYIAAGFAVLGAFVLYAVGLRRV